MRLLASFDDVYAIYISAFLSVSLSEQSFLFTESPIYRIICSRRTVLYVFIQQPRLAIAMFPTLTDLLYSNCTLSHTVLLKGVWNEQLLTSMK